MVVMEDTKGTMSLKDMLSVGGDTLSQPDLLRKVVDGILKLKRHGGRGIEVLPPEVQVKIGVGEGSVKVIQSFLQDPAFDRDVEATLRNQLVHARGPMPIRHYVVEAAPRTQVEVSEVEPKALRLRIAGGDRDGASVALPMGRRDLLMGRGPWHGTDQQVANDIVLSEGEKAISRRAARLHRGTATLELESLDQREALAVLKPDGQRLRPALSASGKVPVRLGDAIEFTDGAKPVVVVHLEEA
jgi:hypothetical protein